ncbi:hypothetical protein L9F63_009575, partial [Diploptera punctata]
GLCGLGPNVERKRQPSTRLRDIRSRVYDMDQALQKDMDQDLYYLYPYQAFQKDLLQRVH